jgi:hypothetical protein
MTAEQRLADALKAEHAAIYGYGVLGAKLDSGTTSLATQAEQAHRNRRDALVVRLSKAGVKPPAAEPAYVLPNPVTDLKSALLLAVAIEEGTAAAWHTALAETSGDDRQLAANALSDCAIRATRARRAAEVSPSTVAFPGSP